MGEKSSLKWYRLAKEEFGQERYVKEFGSKEEVRLRFRLKTVSVGLLWDKGRYGVCQGGRFKLCDDDVVEDVHILLHWGEFAGDKEDCWIGLMALNEVNSGWQSGEAKVMKIE